MESNRQKSLALMLATAAAACGGLAGCGPRAETKALLTAEESNLKPLGILYGRYQSQHENRPPINEADFKRYIQTRGQSILEQFNTDIDQLFVSSRDGQPYIVFYRNNPPPPSGVVAHEREGIDGQRIVAYAFGGVALVDENRFRELVPEDS